MRRREFFTFVVSAAAWPLAARAQQPAHMRRIGVLNPSFEADPEARANVTAFRDSLDKLGWMDGRNVHIDTRWGNADSKRIEGYVTEIVGLKPDVILASSGLVLQPLQRATRSIPIVFVSISDPVGAGIVASLAHPGGNITGFAPAEYTMYGKSLEALKEIAPHVTRAAVVFNPVQKLQAGILRAVEAAAPSLGVQVKAVGVRNAAEIERTIDAFAREPSGGLVVLPNPVTVGNRKLIIAMAARLRLPAVYAFPLFVKDGGLISYGVDLADDYRKAASYVDRILRGEKPADLPVQQPTKFRLLVNLKTANALGLKVPPSLLARADDVIE
jgi:putative ABC transport system substrate-binding protein